MDISTANDRGENRTMRITGTLNAPVAAVWKVWTDPEHIKNWWGPEGFTNTIHTMNVAEGGEWRLTMHGPDGKNYPNKSVFREIVPNKKMVFQHYNPNYIATIVFEPEDEKTLLEWTVTFETDELFETVVKVFKADEGLTQNVGKLTAYLEKQSL